MARKLYPTFNDPDKWRNPNQRQFYDNDTRKQIRQKVLQRDNNTCIFCGFQAEKYMMAHHINDNPTDLRLENLETVCPMCNLILHVGQGAVIQDVVDLYMKSKYSQENIIRITRQLRVFGKGDDEIIVKLNLKGKVPFKQDIGYLENLYGFITSRKAKEDMTIRGLSYVYWEYKNQLEERFKTKQVEINTGA